MRIGFHSEHSQISWYGFSHRVPLCVLPSCVLFSYHSVSHANAVDHKHTATNQSHSQEPGKHRWTHPRPHCAAFMHTHTLIPYCALTLQDDSWPAWPSATCSYLQRGCASQRGMEPPLIRGPASQMETELERR